MEIVVFLVMVAAIVIGLLMRRNRAKAAQVSPPPADFEAPDDGDASATTRR
jgi:hypothetical protein